MVNHKRYGGGGILGLMSHRQSIKRNILKRPRSLLNLMRNRQSLKMIDLLMRG
jgi:hypothetical protein